MSKNDVSQVEKKLSFTRSVVMTTDVINTMVALDVLNVNQYWVQSVIWLWISSPTSRSLAMMQGLTVCLRHFNQIRAAVVEEGPDCLPSRYGAFADEANRSIPKSTRLTRNQPLHPLM